MVDSPGTSRTTWASQIFSNIVFGISFLGFIGTSFSILRNSSLSCSPCFIPLFRVLVCDRIGSGADGKLPTVLSNIISQALRLCVPLIRAPSPLLAIKGGVKGEQKSFVFPVKFIVTSVVTICTGNGGIFMAVLQAEVPASTGRERLLFLDWLRVLAVLGVFCFHTLRPFDSLSDWNIKNPERSFVADAFIAFFFQWGMPLFFVLAGAACRFALRTRSGSRYFRERCLRLLLPLVVGYLLLSPPQAYVEELTHGYFQGSFFQFYPWFFTHIQANWHAPWIYWVYHLWFLIFLWLFTLLALPLFLFLRSDAGQRVIDKIAAWSSRPGMI